MESFRGVALTSTPSYSHQPAGFTRLPGKRSVEEEQEEEEEVEEEEKEGEEAEEEDPTMENQWCPEAGWAPSCAPANNIMSRIFFFSKLKVVDKGEQ